MGELEGKKHMLRQIRSREGGTFEMNEDAILAEYKKQDTNTRGLAIKILSVLGGMLSSLAFLGFLFILGLYESGSGMLITGVGLIVVSIVVSNRFEKLIMDALGVSFYVLGFILFIASLFFYDFGEDGILLSVILVSLVALMFARHYLISFVAIIAASASILLLIISNDIFGAVHVYLSLYAIALTYLMLEEAPLLSHSPLIIKLYGPLRIGIITSFLMGLFILGRDRLIPLSYNFIWVSSIVVLLCIFYVIKTLLADFHVHQSKKLYVIYGMSLLALLPALLAPAISGSLLIILLSFKVNYKTGFVIGVLAFIYAIGQFYYDLQFTLLTKSIMLMASGAIFLLYYWYFKKQWPDEKI